MSKNNLVVREENGVVATDLAKSRSVPGYYQEPTYPSSMQADIRKSEITRQVNRAPNTLRKYTQCWFQFRAYCLEHGVSYLPADPVVVCAFLENVKATVSSVNGEFYSSSNSKLKSLVASINYYHEQASYNSPTKSPKVKDQLRSMLISTDRSLVNNRKRALIDEYFSQLVNYLDAQPKTSTVIRDKAILLLGRQGGFRRSELAAIKVSDLEFQNDKLLVTVRFSKTSQDGSQILVKSLPKSELYSCYDALNDWLNVSKIRSGHLFRSIFANGELRPYFVLNNLSVNSPDKIRLTKRGKKERTNNSGFLSGQDIYRIVLHYVSVSGIPLPSTFGAHSLRSGLVTQLFLNNYQVKQIKNRTGHKSSDMLDLYNQI